MEHSFDINIAKEYGIQAAVLLKNIYFWIEKSKANEMNFFDGYYWTYNSKKAFSDLFPYMTERQIDYALKKLIEEGILITGNYNKMAYDRTLWYAITKKGYSILQNCKMETTNLLNGNDKIVEPIPDNKPYNKPDKKIYIRFGEYKNVFLTKEQYEKILIEFPNDYEERINNLDLYVQSTGKKYKDCLATIRNWARKEKNKGEIKNGKTKGTYGSEFAEFS